MFFGDNHDYSTNNYEDNDDTTNDQPARVMPVRIMPTEERMIGIRAKAEDQEIYCTWKKRKYS